MSNRVNMETCVERISGWTAYRRVTDSNLHANKQQIDAMEVAEGGSDGDDENDVENEDENGDEDGDEDGDENGDEELGDDSQRYQGVHERVYKNVKAKEKALFPVVDPKQRSSLGKPTGRDRSHRELISPNGRAHNSKDTHTHSAGWKAPCEASDTDATSGLSDIDDPLSAPDALGVPAYSREIYTDEKDTMIRYLRDNLENTWATVALLYNQYWGCAVSTRKLSRRYAAIVPKNEQGKKQVGRSTTGDKEKGIKESNKWSWMVSGELLK